MAVAAAAVHHRLAAGEVEDPGHVVEEEVAGLHGPLEPVGQVRMPVEVGVERLAVDQFEAGGQRTEAVGGPAPGGVELGAVQQAHVAHRPRAVEQCSAQRGAAVAGGGVLLEHLHGHEQTHQPVDPLLGHPARGGQFAVGGQARLDVVGQAERGGGMDGLGPPATGDDADQLLGRGRIGRQIGRQIGRHSNSRFRELRWVCRTV
ncbi:hypothetical protein [Streptomyces sp. NPDC091215]|uniref:hypothetical protein n=1 Tax=Streptomyces sp. NPDC091215 TaxID=3155192 RepID=UPI0034204EA6